MSKTNPIKQAKSKSKPETFVLPADTLICKFGVLQIYLCHMLKKIKKRFSCFGFV